MNLPKQHRKIDEDRQALAPYNFVELPESVAAVIEGRKLPVVPEEPRDKEKLTPQQLDDWKEARDKAFRARAEAVSLELPDQNVFEAKRLSGWIDCHLTTASPAYVRAPRTPREAEKRIQAKDLPAFFYEWDKDEPVIPGSTLRGMLRSLVEIASFGKVTDVYARRLVYRAIGKETEHEKKYRELLMFDETTQMARDRKNREAQGNKTRYFFTPKIRGGYMRRVSSDWYIQPAEERKGTTYARISHKKIPSGKLIEVPGCINANKIYADVGEYQFHEYREGFINIREARVTEASDKPLPKLFDVTLARSGHMFSKRSEAVIYHPSPDSVDKDDPAKPDLKGCLKLEDEQIDDYRNQISAEQEKLLGKGGVLRDGQPVFFTVVRDQKGNPIIKDGKLQVDFFGHCRMLRLPYKQSPEDHTPILLRQPTDIDLAEAIFGFTKDPKDFKQKPSNKELRYAGRIRISSARLVSPKEDIWLSPSRPITPSVLGTPKPTTFQHYLVQPEPNPAKGQQSGYGKSKAELRLKDYAALTPNSTVIRGHKLYWHKGAVRQADIQLNERGKGNVTTQIQPVRAGVEFKFQIQFENLSEIELGALLWILRIGADDNYRLKLGMGKPLGMGAVKVVPTLRLIDREARYSQLFDGEEWAHGLQTEEASQRVELGAVNAFEHFVLGRIQPNAAKLGDLERIQELLALLSWPGPDRALTRYMEIERYDPSARRGKRNEYDGRPVLPHPLSLPWRKQESPRSPPSPPPVSPPTRKETEKPTQPFNPLFTDLQPSVPPKTVTTDPNKKPETTDKSLKSGIVKVWGLGAKKAYGFIEPDEKGEDVFVHVSNLDGMTDLKFGDRVQYRLRNKGFKLEAIEVRIISDESEGQQ